MVEEATEAARPVPEDYGLEAGDLRLWYSPGRAGAILMVAATLGLAVERAFDGAAHTLPQWLGAVVGFFYGALLGGFVGLGAMVLLIWCDPLFGRIWPTYGRLRRYREALAAARAAERHHHA
ncbi:MAG TPA: hypothetical protein VD978_14595 [Azospirillum sp.]|nr:hypothetical protein [Azospirillum sp.]